MDQQGPDQLWHSETYGNLKGGAAVTTLTLYALAHVEPKKIEPHRAALQAACVALASQIDRRGLVANPDAPDYPTYASAMLLIAVDRLNLNLSAERQTRLREYLIESQIDQAEGYLPEAPDFGGWDLEGSLHGRRRSTGTNISVGAFVAEALSIRPDANSLAALELYRTWLAKCQNLPGDGGFFFHAERTLDGNKAGWVGEGESLDRRQPRSYGSATADGLRGLVASGIEPSSKPVVAALAWLQMQTEFDRVPGFEGSTDTTWSEGLLFYYWFSIAKSIDILPAEMRTTWSAKLRGEILKRQSADGSWSNPNSRMREDDPLIATAFAIMALAMLEEERE